MFPKLLQLANKLEALSLRERAMALIGVPVVLLLAAEFLVFSPARNQASAARKVAEQKQNEFKALSTALAALPAVAPLPGADQLRSQRDALLNQIDAAGRIMAGVNETVDWGTVVRATVSGTPGLTLTQMRTLPSELVFSPSMAKPVVAATTATAASAAVRVAASAPRPGATGDNVYRHRAELTVKGDVGALFRYLQTLQRVPGDLRWDRLQLSVAAYPQASIQLNLHTLSARAETPFN